MVTDGVVSVNRNVAIRDLMKYVLPYLYGDRHLTIINLPKEDNYVNTQFHEKGGRELPPVIVRLAGKKRSDIALANTENIKIENGSISVNTKEMSLREIGKVIEKKIGDCI